MLKQFFGDGCKATTSFQMGLALKQKEIQERKNHGLTFLPIFPVDAILAGICISVVISAAVHMMRFIGGNLVFDEPDSFDLVG